MLLVSPSIALVTLVILSGWMYFSSERGRISWQVIAVAVFVFIAGLFILSAALNRQGNLGDGSPIGVINNFIHEALKWNVFKIEEGSGWVQKLFDEMPEWIRLPFVMVYGFLQPVLPAILFVPTTIVWKVIGILRAVGWYAILPALILSFAAAAGSGGENKRKLFLGLSLFARGVLLFTVVLGGGDRTRLPARLVGCRHTRGAPCRVRRRHRGARRRPRGGCATCPRRADMARRSAVARPRRLRCGGDRGRHPHRTGPPGRAPPGRRAVRHHHDLGAHRRARRRPSAPAPRGAATGSARHHP